MANEIKIYQFEDNKGNKVAPKVPERAVVDEKGITLDNKLKGLGLDAIKEAQDAAIAAVEASSENLSKNVGLDEYETFSDAKAYSAGDAVMYNGLLYTFITDHSAGAFDEGQVVSTTLSKQLKQTQIDADALKIAVAPTEIFPFNAYYSTSKQAIAENNETYNGYCVRVFAGATYTINNIMPFNNTAFLFSEYPNIGLTVKSSLQFNNNRITIPNGITYIVINTEIANIQQNATVSSINVISVFSGSYKDGGRDSIVTNGVYNNVGTNPAILFVRNLDNNENNIWQFEITTVPASAPILRLRKTENAGETWSDWQVLNMSTFLANYAIGYVTVTMLNAALQSISDANADLYTINRRYFNILQIKNGWVSSSGAILYKDMPKCFSMLVGVTEGDIVNYTNGYQYALLKDDYNPETDIKVIFVDGTTRVTEQNPTEAIVIPANCKYLWLSGHYSETDEQDMNYQADTITINGVTYPIQDGRTAYIPSIGEQVNALIKNSTKYPKGILKYTTNNKTFQFFMYRGIANEYYAITVRLSEDNSDEVYLNEYRFSNGGLYTYNNGAFTFVCQTIIDLENEMAMKFNNSDDYTGGIHGDERIDVDPQSFAKFFADGKLLTDEQLSTDFTMECAEFSYIQYSTLHETSGITDKLVTEHPIIAHHLKNHTFRDCISALDNTVKFDIDDYDYANLVINQYHATIACIAKGGATTTLLPDFIIVDTSAGTNASTSSNNPNNAITTQWNASTGVKITTEGHFTEGLSDDMKNNPSGSVTYQVWDRSTDSKIYRRYLNINKTVTKNFVLRNHQEIHFS